MCVCTFYACFRLVLEGCYLGSWWMMVDGNGQGENVYGGYIH